MPSPQSSYNGDFSPGWRPKDLQGEEKHSLRVAPGTDVQTEHSTTPGGARGRHSRQLKACGAGGGCRKKERATGRLDSLLQLYPQEAVTFLALPSSNVIVREKLRSETSE